MLKSPPILLFCPNQKKGFEISFWLIEAFISIPQRNMLSGSRRRRRRRHRRHCRQSESEWPCRNHFIGHVRND